MTTTLEPTTGNSLLIAKLVYDGGESVSIPGEMGTPRADQMQGTPAEQLSELAGRVCYDSLGKGRPSFSTDEAEGYHDHILKVGHGSVLEHFNFTVEIPLNKKQSKNSMLNQRRVFCMACMNRPGVLTFHAKNAIRVTLNLRAVHEWLNWEEQLYGKVSPLARQFSAMFHYLGHQLAPHVIAETPLGDDEPYLVAELQRAAVVRPKWDHEQWITMFLCGSRGFSHELVRHGDFTAISQRSTRFVDEDGSPWVEHPLTAAYRRMYPDHVTFTNASFSTESVIRICRKAYYQLAGNLELWLTKRGVDKTSARKQARGAARGYLGNALHTELIFSANVSQWKRMLRQRASVFADAEIREVFCKALAELKQSRYAASFEAFELQSSPDGIGQIAVERQ